MIRDEAPMHPNRLSSYAFSLVQFPLTSIVIHGLNLAGNVEEKQTEKLVNNIA